MEKIRIVLVDDHEMLRYGLRWSLQEEPDMVVVAEAGTGEEATRCAREHRPDVMLLDVRLADMDGPDVCRDVLGVVPTIAVVMLTSYAQEGLILRSFAAGAKGYMIKDVALDELKSAIRSVHRGHTVLDPKVTGSLIARVTAQAPGVRPGPPAAQPKPVLSDLEVTIVRHLSEGLTTKEIAVLVSLSTHTIKDRLEKIREKLVVRSRTAIVVEALKRGLI